MDLFFSTHNPLFFLMIALFLILSLTYLFIQLFLIPQQRKHAIEKKEIELKNEKKIALFTSLSPNPVFRFDMHGKILLTNNAGTELTNGENPVGMNIKTLIPGLQNIDFSEIINGVQEFSVDAMVRDKEYSVYVKGIPDSIFGHIYCYDITERKKAIDALISAKEKAEEMDRLKTNFLANMSHELRTPLIGILGYSELLIENLMGTHDGEFAKVIHSSGTRLHDTLNKILDLTQIQSQRLEVRKSEIEIVKKVADEVKLFDRAAVQKGLYLKIESDADAIIAVLDETLLRQIMNNLLSNSIKYTNEGGVTVRIKNIQKGGKHYVSIEVIDTGIGISKENQAYIWEEFRQESEGFGRSFEGTGLGLTIAKNFIEKLDGEISLESEEGKGSTFTVLLPCESIRILQKNDMPEPNIPEVDSIVNGSQIKILPDVLYVDDDPYSSSLVRIFLKNICHIDAAFNSHEAEEKTKRRKYAAVLMDINLGFGKNGLETTELIRKLPGYEHVPIIAITAYAMVGDKENFLNKGCTHYISKPFDREQITTLLREVLKKS